MTLRLEPYSDALIPAVRAFNDRIAKVAPQYRLGTASVAGRDPRAEGRLLFTETLLAVDGEHVRGGVILQHQGFELAGARSPVINIQLPVSEGLVDKQYASVGMWIIKSVLQSYPLAFAVGMGGFDQPLPKLLQAMRWTVQAVPFFFHVHRVRRFLREMPQLRGDARRRAAASLAAATGLGWLGVRLYGAWGGRRGLRAPVLQATRESEWGPWADGVWEGARGAFSLSAVRDRLALRELYPPGTGRYLCYRLSRGGRTVGWVVLLRTQMRGSAAFGNLTVGTVLDCLALPGYETAAVRAARRLLAGLGVDLSLSNQAHLAWQGAFRDAGYLGGPSNFLLATSRALTEGVRAAGSEGPGRMHVNRGDGDGRIHL
jgi:hypothetical protein